MTTIGPRLRALRNLHGLSQRQLAAKAGVSNATISLIEHDRTDPSMGMLKRVLDVFPMSLAEFFASESPSSDPVFFRHGELSDIQSGPVSFKQVGTDLEGHQLQILYERYAPGADTGISPLSHDSEEGGIVIQGQLEITVAEQTRVLKPGDAYLFNSNLPHRFRNVGHDDAVVVSACTPPTF